MTDIQNKDNGHWHVHNHTYAEQTKELYSGKYHNFTYVSSKIYLMTKCVKSGIKVVYNYKNKKYIITMGRQNVTSESTPSGPLT